MSNATSPGTEKDAEPDVTHAQCNMDDENKDCDTSLEHNKSHKNSASENEAEREQDEQRKHLSNINRSLLYCKLFYFCYNAALGALWPYIPLYFRQLFLTPRQAGTIVASRTFIQFLCTPFWSGIAEKYNRHKMILLLAVMAWLLSTMGLLLIPAEEPKACFKMSIKRTSENDNAEDTWFDFTVFQNVIAKSGRFVERIRRRDEYSMINFTGISSPKYSAYDPDKHVTDDSRVYLLLLLVTILGTSISAPGLVLADIFTLQRLKGKTENYGKQVLWGSLGFGLLAFSIGASVSLMKTSNPCTKTKDTNFVPCFYMFAFFMTLTLLISSQFTYDYSTERKDRAGFIKGLKSIQDIHLGSLLVVTFYCGMGSGFISTFLFWHLREMGAMQLLLAIVTLINSTAEVLFYLLSDRVIHCIGHFRVIYIGLLCLAARFFYYSFLRAPWMVLPIEITQGMTSAAIRSALVSYVGREAGAGTVLQGVFNGVHSGLGFSVGGLTGGLMVHEFGHSTTFLIFGEVSLVIMFSFILINNIWPITKREAERNKLLESPRKDTEDNKLQDGTASVMNCNKDTDNTNRCSTTEDRTSISVNITENDEKKGVKDETRNQT